MIHLFYQLTEDDFVSAAKLMLSTRKSQRRMRYVRAAAWVVLALALIVIASALIITRGLAPGLMGLLVLPALLLVRPGLIGWQFRRQFRRTPNLSALRTLEADDSSVSIRSPLAGGNLHWELVERWAENEAALILVQQGGQIFFPVSKHNVDASSLEQLRELLRRHVGDRK